MNKIMKRISGFPLFLPILALVLVLLFNLIKTPNFFKITILNGVFYGFIVDIINRASELVIIAIGMTLVVASSAGTDISVGAVSAVTAAIICYALGPDQQSYQIPYIFGILLALCGGVLCGMWNGFLVAKMKIQPMVATLILFTAGRGISQLICSGQIIHVEKTDYRILGSFIPHVPLPTPVFVATIILLLTWFVMKYTALGMYIQTVGINSRAGRLVGINSQMIIFLTYAFCGLCSGIAGLIMSSRIAACDANNIGLNIELDAILAVALGGNSLGGGKFSLSGSVIGAITIQALTTSLYAMHVTADQLPIYKAIVVVIIVTIQSAEFKRWVSGIKRKHAVKAEVAQ
ncbi:MAG: ABC transporter permease [Flexilinea sp.]